MVFSPNSPALRSLTAALALAGAPACATLRVGGPDPEAAAAGQARLEAATKRWQGSRWVLAAPVETGESIYVAKGEASQGEFYYRVLVEDRPAPDAAFDGRVLRESTAFLAEGWRLKDGESGKGPYLELRFADQSGRARVEFRGVRQFDFDGFPLDRLEEVEDFCRRTLFSASGADAPVPAPPSAPAK